MSSIALLFWVCKKSEKWPKVKGQIEFFRLQSAQEGSLHIRFYFYFNWLWNNEYFWVLLSGWNLVHVYITPYSKCWYLKIPPWPLTLTSELNWIKKIRKLAVKIIKCSYQCKSAQYAHWIILVENRMTTWNFLQRSPFFAHFFANSKRRT